MSDTTICEKRFKVRDAYKVFTEELGIEEGMAEGLVHRNYWILLNRMRAVAAGDLKPPAFNCDSDLEEFMYRCGDVCFGYVYEFNAYSGEVCVDMEDGGNVAFMLGDVIGSDLLKNPSEMDEWAPWARQDLKTIDRIIEENANPAVEWSDIEMYDYSSDGQITLKYKLKDKE